MSSTFSYDQYMMYNPEGKVKQLEYVNKTTELGNTCVALKGKNSAVLIAHNPVRSSLAFPQNKIYVISDKEDYSSLFTFAGITNDGLSMVQYLKHHAVVENVLKDRNIQPMRVFDDLVVSMSYSALTGDSRLLGASGILVSSDYNNNTNNTTNNVSIVIITPDGKVRSVKGGAIGNRNQSCRTILEEELHENMETSELISVGLNALRHAHPDEKELKSSEVEIYVIDKNIMKVNSAEYIE